LDAPGNAARRRAIGHDASPKLKPSAMSRSTIDILMNSDGFMQRRSAARSIIGVIRDGQRTRISSEKRLSSDFISFSSLWVGRIHQSPPVHPRLAKRGIPGDRHCARRETPSDLGLGICWGGRQTSPMGRSIASDTNVFARKIARRGNDIICPFYP
jgi:hypothetical protein